LTDSDLLLTIAEVAVTFAGFASLVGILGRRSSRDDPRVLGVRMRAMLLFSLLAVAFSLLPLILHRYEFAEASIWRASSTLFAVLLAAVGGWVLLSITRLRRLDIPRRPAVRIIGAVLAATIPTGIVILFVNALALAPSLLAALYVTGLGLVLFVAGFAFSLILFSFLPDISSE
jgi:hypothetical protein